MQDEIIRLLVIEDEKYDVDRIINTLKPNSARIQIKDVVKNGYDAIALITTTGNYDVVIMDYQISGGLYGEALIRKIKAVDPTLPILVITKMTINQADLGFANKLLESGAYWYGTKYPGDIEEFIYQPTDLVLSIMNAYTLRQSEMSQNRIQRRLEKKINAILTQSPLLGESSEMKNLKMLIEKYARPNANVLIIGDSGTGKELIATNIHYKSERRFEAFISINCAAIPKDLIESELFGYERGAFTGAVENKPGLFEQANGGTLFLDEITELSSSAQAKLLRVLQDGEIDKIGRQKKYNVNVRVIAATNRKPDELLKNNILREDLFYRLNILQIQVPPLKERLGDIPLLVHHFIGYYCREMGQTPLNIHPDAMRVLENYTWPGNVRQLKNVVQRMVILAGESGITKELVDTSMGGVVALTPGGFNSPELSLKNARPLKEVEREFRCRYVRFIQEHARTDTEAAQLLGMAPSNFHRLCRELGFK